MKAKYKVGSWFAVPLEGGGHAVGILARSAPKGKIYLGYFFGPIHENVPALEEILHYTADQSIFVQHFGDLGLHNGEWTVIGNDPNFRKEDWHMPVFGTVDKIGDLHWKVTYDEQTNEISRVRTTRDIASKLPEDGMAGYKFIEIRLSIILGSTAQSQ